MIYLKSTLAGIAGSILAIVTVVVAIIIMNVTASTGMTMVAISIFLPLGVVLLGFAAGFSLMFTKLSRRSGERGV